VNSLRFRFGEYVCVCVCKREYRCTENDTENLLVSQQKSVI